ncbi:hypothetical protein IL099_000610 [Enterococcus hirae]|nr:hypothetical protein [Enterococcus hirae]
MTYEGAIHCLLNKYGRVVDDFFREQSYTRFLQGDIKNITKGKYSKTSEGLYCHHIDENKYENLSSLNYIKNFKYPFIYQKKERLVYCDLFEHLILHALIIKETKAQYGLSGYEIFLYPTATQWFQKKLNPKPEWMKKCKQRAYITPTDAKDLLNKIEDFTKPVREAYFAKLQAESKQRIKQEKANRLGMTIPQYEEYLIQEERKEKERLRLEELKKKDDFNKKYPKLKKIGVDNNTPRKKILNILYEHGYYKYFTKKKDFYDSKLTFIRDKLLEELNNKL